MKLKELAEQIGFPFFGDGEVEVSGVRDLAFPTPISPNHIYYVGSKKAIQKNPKSSDIKIALTIEKLKPEFPGGILVTETDAKLALARILKNFEKEPNWGEGISDKASVSDSAKIGQNVRIMDFAVVMEQVELGENVVIHPNVVLEPGAKIGKNTVIRSNTVIGYNCVVGENCIIHSNTTIGADGFGFIDHKGERHKIPQIGNVIIGNHVEIGAGCTIDRAAIEYTSIGNHTKLDDQVHVGHNCRLGEKVFMAGTAGLAGGVVLEDYVMVGGQAAIAEHLTIGKGGIVMGLTGVTKDVEEKNMVFGTPARPATEMLRISSVLAELPELIKRVKKLEESQS